MNDFKSRGRKGEDAESAFKYAPSPRDKDTPCDDRRPGKSGAAGAVPGALRVPLLCLVLVLCWGLVGWYSGAVYTGFGPRHLRKLQAHGSRRGGLGGGGQRRAWPDGAVATFQFTLCNGFANQRFALLSGIVMAMELDRAVVLPRFVLNGTQATTADVSSADAKNTAKFGALFNETAFAQQLAQHGVKLAAKPPARAVVSAKLPAVADPITALAGSNGFDQHLSVDCPIFRVPPRLLVKHEALILGALAALQPTGDAAAMLAQLEGRLRRLSPDARYNVLHLRAEDDWILHCARWENMRDGIVRDNCMNNTETVGQRLLLHGVDPEVPLLVATSWSQASDGLVQRAMASLKKAGYQPVVRAELLERGQELEDLGREESALVEYYLGLRSHQFIGNSVSSFSAMIILERWQADKFAAYYNGGNIPLERYLPLYRMPWVFTYNDWSSGSAYDEMAKAAVRSAIDVGRVKPFCMFSGNKDSPMYDWLIKAGVTMMEHVPVWRDAIVQEARRHREAFSKKYSPLYSTDGMVVGTFQRIDIPMHSALDQYNFVLFTDVDVFIRKPILLVDWGTPLPEAHGMSFDMQDMFPYNAGVTLMNIPFLRQTNADFIAWLLKQRNGLYFGPMYGPLDQGAINAYYEAQIRDKPISKNYNAKPYQLWRPNALIVHFHGPKLTDYLDWLLTGRCGFGQMCEDGVVNALCPYAREYDQWNPTWEVASMLHRLCEQGKLALLKSVHGGKALAKGGGGATAAAAAVVTLPDPGEVDSAQ